MEFIGAGSCVIDANQAGNTSYTAAAQQQQTLTVGYTRTITTAVNGKLTIGAGQAVLLASGGTIGGKVTIEQGGALDSEGGKISAPVYANGAAAIRACNGRIGGAVTVMNVGGSVVFGDDDGGASCPGNTITGPVQITGNTGGVEFDDNTVTGSLSISGNSGNLLQPDSGSVDAIGNYVAGTSTIQR